MKARTRKRCSHCQEIKPIAEFYSGRRVCKVCFKIQRDNYDKAYPDAKRERNKRWANSHREHEAERVRRWKENNRERILIYSRNHNQKPEAKEYRRKWEKEHQEERRISGRIYAERRRARKAEAQGSHTVEQWLEIRAFYGRCLACGRTDVELTEDHIIPISCGGSNDIGNIQPLCQSCNSVKGTKIIDYRAEQAF